jgi:hypothetical protein
MLADVAAVRGVSDGFSTVGAAAREQPENKHVASSIATDSMRLFIFTS